MAMAPEQTGIGIRRHFTTEGVHPFDEVTWERRDARIVNFRDGSVAFEQRDVEFPLGWSLNATNIVAQKYFRGQLGSPEREQSLRQVIDRVSDTITDWGVKDGYFVDDAEAEAFRAELKHLILHQKAAFNSPVWFNIGVPGANQQASACFILAVEDTMQSILNWYVEEGTIFKGGSGAGINLSNIRSSYEHLKGGGTASGPVSFMRGADASAGTIKSGGTTRRAAKMVVLNADHPDIEDFIWCKAVEERKARVLRDNGFDMDLDGKDSHSTQYQNANNSVRVTDEFMAAVVDDADWGLKAVGTGEVLKTVKARELFRQMAESAWECADPGMQYDTTINKWHTASNTGRINASNPCFTADSLVHTDKGLIRFDDLLQRAQAGETFGVYTHDATNPDVPAEVMQITSPAAYMVTGLNEIVRLRFSNGMELRCTPNHRVFTVNRGYVEASELTTDDQVKVLDLPAPAFNAEARLPVSSDVSAYAVKGDWSRSLRLPEKWSPELAHYLGWVVGDGCISGDMVTTVYGGDDQADVLPRHSGLLTWMNGDREPKPSVQANGTLRLRQTRRVTARFLEALGVTHSRAAEKTIPWSIQQAPPDAVAAFLRGLFDADGCVYDGKTNRYVGLGSASSDLLRGAQRLLATFGIFSRIYNTQKAGKQVPSYKRKDGSSATYISGPMFDLRIAAKSITAFAQHIGFGVEAKATKLQVLLAGRPFAGARNQVRLIDRTDDGVELTYNLTEPRNHSYVVNGIVVANCSEYVHLDNSACNLASLNLLKFLNEDGTFDVEGFKAAVEVVFTAQEILVGNADYPTKSIGETTRRFRQLGLGYANLGAMLMAIGVPYDSDQGRAWASGITALMTGHAYATSARTAARMGPFAGYMENQEPMNNVLRMHRDELGTIDTQAVPADILAAADESWSAAVEWGRLYGVRNSQATVLAPTGCLVGGSLVPTSKGLVRLATLGDPEGPQWQDLNVDVATDQGPRPASQFYVNGLEPVVSVRTNRGYGIEGTTQHRVKVIDRATGAWEWKRFADLEAGDVVPLALNQLLGRPNRATLPAIPVLKAGDGTDIESHLHVPSATTPQLAELAGYFIAEGSVSAKGLTFNVSDSDLGVVEHIERLGKEAFGVPALVSRRRSGTRVAFRSPRLAEWWSACGFSRRPLLPDAVLRTNDRSIYAAFLRGLFQAGGQVASALPRWSTPSLSFSREVQSLLLALGYPTIRTLATERGGWRQAPVATVRLLNSSLGGPWLDEVGFMSERANRAVAADPTSTRHDDIPLPAALVARLAPANPWLTGVITAAGGKDAGPGITMVSRTAAVNLFERSQDRELGHLLAFFYDRVASAELGDDELTYDISVPDNVTYLANGFVSHNTIGLMMDCDTTGIEPDLGLCKTKKLVGGGTMSIVNQTVPRALRRMGYSPEQVDDIVAYIDEHKSIVGAPHLSADKLAVFACSMGDNVIHYLGHVKMMAAVQPWISGAISKCVTGDTLLATADGLVRIGRLHHDEPADSFRPEIIEVASVGGTQKTDAFYYGGVRPVRKAVLESGHRVMGTPNHRLLVAGECGLDWRRLDELEVGDAVAVHYGADLWSSLPARLDGAVPVLPVLAEEMTSELAFLLGALAAAGRADRAAADGPSVIIDGVADSVLARIAEAWAHDVGLPAGVVDGDSPGDPGAAIAASPLAVQLLGSASTHVPDAVLASPKEMVLAYLEGLSLAADVSVEADGSGGSWSLVLDCETVLDEVQSVLTNLGVVHWRAASDRIEVAGRHAQHLVDLVPFAEPAKQEKARALAGTELADEPESAMPGLSGDDRAVVGHDLRFSPVVSVSDAGRREVFDVSVPTTHAFVGNGIVNHNTINMPEEATVEEVEQLHIDAWRMGLKAVAIYRDNCKVGQPLSTTKKGGATGAPAAAPALVAPAAPVPATLVSTEPVRRKMPRVRKSKTMSFRVADCHGYVTVGEYDDGRPGEIFLKVAKQGSTLAGIMDAFAISVSHGLQYGVPLRAFVDMYTNMRFEPAGMTDDPDIRFASSLVDYIFRRLAVEYLSYEDRAELGILTVEERMQPTLPGVEEQSTPSTTGSDIVPDPVSVMAPPVAPPAPEPTPVPAPTVQPVASDAPYCYQCGMVMQRAGACFVCSTCGTTSGCS